MTGVLEIVLPVFVLIAAGYGTVWKGWMTHDGVEILTKFTQNVAIPCLLFAAVARLNLSAVFSLDLFLSYYLAATIAFVTSGVVARLVFQRTPGASVAIGFSALFSNSVLLGLAITERAFGAAALTGSFAIVSVHAPFCYLLGIITMEMVRADGRGATATIRAVARTIFRNVLSIALLMGFFVNLTGMPLPNMIWAAVDMMGSSALPVALFGLGGVMVQYKIWQNLPEVAAIGVIKLVMFPVIAYVLSVYVFDLPEMLRNAVVLTASMAPGINTYLFASMYDRGKATAASAVVVLTAVSVVTVSIWLVILGA